MDDDLADITRRVDWLRPKIRPPQSIANALSNLMSKRGYARVLATSSLDDLWQTLIGPRFAGDTRCGNVKRGVLEVTVNHSAIVQELNFQKKQLLTQIQAQAPDQNIKDLRFKVGAIH